ncbi:stanniocalcin-2a [Neoarius graeffei]|uniref:stanniocalcin-2a n=1 Tax=Neoarius graeffei TaxID=443677 RepID=UPI00298BE973|nr:stanniocalcin-2a [Neoarius graeffei]
MLARFAVGLLVFSVIALTEGTDTTDAHETHPEKATSPNPNQKGRLSLHNTAEIQHCLVNAGDVGCGVFECFENNSCEIRGLQEICLTFLHNAGKFDSQGKSFIKDALKCMAHGLRHKFSCISRKCLAIKEMVFQLQRECYTKHNLCAAAKDNVNVIVEMIHFQDLLPKGPYVELVNILLACGEEVKEAISRSVRIQCEQNWGALCHSLSFCSSPPPLANQERHASQHDHSKGPRQADKEKPGKGGSSTHPRNRGQGARRTSLDATMAEQEDPENTDIRR